MIFVLSNKFIGNSKWQVRPNASQCWKPLLRGHIRCSLIAERLSKLKSIPTHTTFHKFGPFLPAISNSTGR
jgi:hypothetical protein